MTDTDKTFIRDPLYHPADGPSREMSRKEIITQYRRMQEGYTRISTQYKELQGQYTTRVVELEAVVAELAKEAKRPGSPSAWGNQQAQIALLENDKRTLERELELIRKSNSQLSYKMDAALSAQRDAEAEVAKLKEAAIKMRASKLDPTHYRIAFVSAMNQWGEADRDAILDSIRTLILRVGALEAERRGDEADRG